MGLLRAELRKMARRGLVWWLAGGVLAMTLLRGLVFPPDPATRWPGLWSAGLVSAAVCLLAAVTVGQELADGTWRMLAARGVARWKLIAAPWLVLVLAGALLLLAVESLAVLIQARHELAWAELLRAWLAQWPLVSLTMLLAVLARGSGLPLILGALQLGLEQFAAMVLGPLTLLAKLDGFWRIAAPDGPIFALYRSTLTYNAAMWTYQADPVRMPVGINAIALATTRPAGVAALVLAAYTLAGVGLSALIVYRRELTEVMLGSGRARRSRGARPADAARARRPARLSGLPLGTGRGPIVVRLAYAHLSTIAHTSLVKIGVGAMLLFALAVLGIASAMDDPGGFFRPLPGAAASLALGVCLLMAGLLASILGIFAVASELSFGTRRTLLARGVTHLQVLAGQSLGTLVVAGALLAGLLVGVLALGGVMSGVVPAGSALLVLASGLLVSATYIGIAQVGASVVRSPLGPMFFGLGLLLLDWLAIVIPTLNFAGAARFPVRYSLTSLAYGLVTGQPLIGRPGGVAPLGPLPALALLLAAALLSHAVALAVSRRRDV